LLLFPHIELDPRVNEWLADNPRWVFHFTPTSAKPFV